jgi:26S proteasome regulatory subunit T1
MVEEARENIPILARGFQESKRYMSEEEISTFLNRAIRNRIAIRLIAEQHISQSAMSSSSSPFVTSSPSPSSSSKPNTKIGIIDTECSPLEMIQMCGRYVTELCEGTLGRSPELIVDGERDARFHYVPVHVSAGCFLVETSSNRR